MSFSKSSVGREMIVKPARVRFGIQSLLAFTFVVAINFAFPDLRDVLLWMVWITGPAAALLVFWVVRGMTHCHLRRWPRTSGWSSVLISALALFACLFIRHRWVNAHNDDDWPRALPYPDTYLVQVHDWWDRLHPAAPNAIKIHGEYYSILYGVNGLLFAAFLVFGAVAGYVFRDTDLARGRDL